MSNEGYVTADTICTLLRTLADAGLQIAYHDCPGQCPLPTLRPGAVAGATVGYPLVILAPLLTQSERSRALWRFVRKQSLNSTWFDSFEQFQGPSMIASTRWPLAQQRLPPYSSTNSNALKMYQSWPPEV